MLDLNDDQMSPAKIVKSAKAIGHTLGAASRSQNHEPD